MKQKQIKREPVFLHHITSLKPGQVESYPAVHPHQFRFSTPEKPVFYQAYRLVFWVVR